MVQQQGYITGTPWTGMGYITSAAVASAYVPYTGATGAVDLGTNTFKSGKATFGTSTGSGFINLPAGTTNALCGIDWGNGVTLYRGTSALLVTDCSIAINGTSTGIIISGNNIYTSNAAGLAIGLYGGGNNLNLYANNGNLGIRILSSNSNVLIGTTTDLGRFSVQGAGSTYLTTTALFRNSSFQKY